MIAEFIRVGFSPDDLISHNGVLKEILSIEKTESASIITFKQQFEKLYEKYAENHHGRFLFKISNIWEGNRKEEIKINRVKIFNRTNLEINTQTWNDEFIKRFNEFINEKNSWLAEISLNYKSEKRAKQYAIRQIREAIDFINFIGKDDDKMSNGGILDTSTTFILFSEGVRGLWEHDKLNLPQWKIEHKRTNLYPKRFNLFKPSVQNRIRQNDKLLFKAKSTNYWDEQIAFYWRYFESFFLEEKFEKSKGEKIIKYLSRILLLKEIEVQRLRLEATIAGILLNLSMSEDGMNYPEIAELVEKCTLEKEDFNVLKKYSSYPFFKLMFSKYENIKNDVNLKSAKNFHNQLLWQTYEQRNAIFHSNLFCPLSIEMLKQYIPSLTWRFRILLLDKLLDNNGMTISEAIEELYKDSSDMV